MVNTKISNGQTIALLFLCSAFSTMNYVPALFQLNNIPAILIANIIGTFLKILLIIPFLMLTKKYGGQNILSICYDKCKWLSYCIAFIYAFSSLADIIGNTFSFNLFMVNIIYPSASSITIIGTFLAACLLCAHYGIEGLARASTIIFILFILGIISIGLFSIPSINLLNIKPILDNPIKTIFEALLQIIIYDRVLVLLLFIAPKSNKHIKGSSIATILFSSILLELINFLIITVLGEFAYEQTFPFFTLATLVETPIFQRLDSIHMLLWIFISFIKITTSMIILKYCLTNLLPHKLHRYCMIPLMGIAGSVSLYLSTRSEYFVSDKSFNALLVIFLILIIPLIVYLLPSKRKRDTNET